MIFFNSALNTKHSTSFREKVLCPRIILKQNSGTYAFLNNFLISGTSTMLGKKWHADYFL